MEGRQPSSKMVSERVLQQVVAAIHAQSELYGVMIGFHGNGSSRLLHAGFVPALNFQRLIVIIEEEEASGRLMARSTPIPARPTPVSQPPAFVTNRSRVSAELIGAGLSCGLTVISGLGVFGGVAAEVPTGGVSTALVVLAWTGLVTSGLQCVNGVTRGAAVLLYPDANSLQQWDDNRIYSATSLIVDAIGIGSAIISLPFAVRNLLAILGRRGSTITAAELSRLSRPERQAAIEEAIRVTTRTPEGRQAVEAALRDAGLSSRQAASTMTRSTGTLRRTRLVAKALSMETARRLNATLRDIIGGGGGIAGSATPANLTGSASGSVNFVIVHVMNRE